MMQHVEAARFHFRRGDAEIDIKCAANEPMQACVTAAEHADGQARQPAAETAQ